MRYHIQDNSVYIGDGSDSEAKYETSKLNPANRRFYNLTVRKEGDTGMTITDNIGQTRNVVTTEGLYNNMCREYAFDTGKNTIYTSSYAVVHLIDGALIYDEEQLEEYE